LADVVDNVIAFGMFFDVRLFHCLLHSGVVTISLKVYA